MSLSIRHKILFAFFSLLANYTTIAQNATQIFINNSFSNIVTFNNIHSNNQEFMVTYAGEHYFVTEYRYSSSPSSRSLYKMNGTAATRIILNFSIDRIVGVFQNKLFFVSQHVAFPSKLYSYDGTTIQQIPAVNIESGTEIRALQNKLIFSGSKLDTVNNTSVTGLMEYDGTNSSIIRPFRPMHLTVDSSNNILYFAAQNLPNDYLGAYQNNAITHLDSFPSGHISPVSYLSPASGPYLFQDKLYFIAQDTTNNRYSIIHHYDGNTIVPLLNNGTPYFNPSSLTEKNGVLYFLAYPDTTLNVEKAYQYANSQVTLVSDNNYIYHLGLASCSGDWLQTYDNSLFFGGEDPITNQAELYQKDGNNTITTFDLSPRGSFNARNFIVYNNRLYFAADSGKFNSNIQLWEYDGQFFRQITDPHSIFDSNPDQFQIIDGELYFTGGEFFRNNKRLFKISTLPHTINVNQTPPKTVLKIFPNPTTGQITLQANSQTETISILNAARIESVQILNLDGKIILTPNVNSINISSLATGIYILQAQTSEGMMYQKVIKK